MEVRKLRGNASVIPSGGSTKTYKQRESGIFFASAGFAEDFDDSYSLSTKKAGTYTRNSEYRFGGSELKSYVSKENINRRKVYCFGYKEGFYNGSYIGEFVVKIKQEEEIYLEISVASSSTGLKLRKKTSPNSSSGETIESNENISLKAGIIEACFDLDEKKVTVWHNNTEVSFDIPDNLIADAALIDTVYWGDMYSDCWSELALSDSRIGDICIKPMLTNAIGDSNDFLDDVSTSPIIGNYSSSTSIQATEINSKQLYKFSVPALPTNAQIDSIFTSVTVKGDDVNAMCDLIKVGENEFEGEAVVVPATNTVNIAKQYIVNPVTGEAWLKEDLAELQVGCKILGVPE
ncbi:MAG: hypothetical protein ACI3ZR_00095 [bacterium]